MLFRSSGATGQRGKECFSLPFHVEPNATSSGAELAEFQVAPRAFGVPYQISISRSEGDFGASALYVSKEQGTSPSVEFSVNDSGRSRASCNLTPGEYYFNVGFNEAELAGSLLKPFGWDNNCSVLVRGVDVS